MSHKKRKLTNARGKSGYGFAFWGPSSNRIVFKKVSEYRNEWKEEIGTLNLDDGSTRIIYSEQSVMLWGWTH